MKEKLYLVKKKLSSLRDRLSSEESLEKFWKVKMSKKSTRGQILERFKRGDPCLFSVTADFDIYIGAEIDHGLLAINSGFQTNEVMCQGYVEFCKDGSIKFTDSKLSPGFSVNRNIVNKKIRDFLEGK